MHCLATNKHLVDIVSIDQRHHNGVGGRESFIQVLQKSMLPSQHSHTFVGIHSLPSFKLAVVDLDNVDGDLALFSHFTVEKIVILLAFDDVRLPGSLRDVVFEVGRR